MNPQEETALLDRVTVLEEEVQHLTEHVQGQRDRMFCDICRKRLRGF